MNNHRKFDFTKMQGTGNDFIIHDLRESGWTLDRLVEWTPRLCDRRYGIGGDGLIVLTDSQQAAYTMIYRNADGSDAGMCGNGGRCIARYAVMKGFNKRHKFQVHDQLYDAEVQNSVVTLGFPSETRVSELPEEIGGYQVYPGTEHIVLPVEQTMLRDQHKLYTTGRNLREHSHFQPVGTNVNFMHGESSQSLNVQTYERGVEDLTLACGTGAIASALAWHFKQRENDGSFDYTVYAEGGELQISFTYDETRDTYSNLKLRGPAHFVFEGTYYL